VDVLVNLSALHIEDIDQHLNITEYVVPLGSEIVLHERLLPTTIPQIQHQIAQKSDIRLLDIDC